MDNRYSVAGCKGFVCSAPTDPEGYLLTEVDLRGDTFDVQAKCAPGFHGTAKAKNCLRHLDGYRLEGCVRAEVCFSPKTSVGYDVTETSLSRLDWKVEAKCADAYTGAPKVTKCKQGLEAYELSGCEAKINCESPDSTDGYLVTERNTVAQLFDVPVSCARGWEGTAQVAPCAASGEKYTLSGCSYSTLTCAAPKSTEGYLVTEAELRKVVFDVAVKCAPGYVGVAKVQTCEKDLGEYVLSGCSKAPVCTSPKDLSGYSITEVSLDKVNFEVSAECSATHTGKAQVRECVGKMTPYSLSGCDKKILCDSPHSTDGYLVTEKNTVAQLFDVDVSCARGYEGKGVVTKCAKTGQQYKLSGCKYSTTTCVAPKSQVGYLVTEVELRKIIFEVNAKCAPGYQGLGKATKCSVHNGPYTLSGCTPAPVCVSPKDLTGYVVEEKSLDRDTFKVEVQCADTHTGKAKVSECTKNLGTYSVSGCAKKIQCASPESDHYLVTEKNTVAQTFDVAVACARGYEGKAVATACSKTGQQYQLSGCKYSTTTCVAPTSQLGYLVTEVELRKIIFEVNAQCAPGYQGAATTTKCSGHNGPYTLSGCTPAPVCVSPKDLTGYSVTETSLDRSSFKVQVACLDTHTGAAKVAPCTKNLGTYSLSGCAKKIECASPSFEGYAVTEQNTVAQTFDVAATCARDYEGKAVATACSKTGEKYTLSGCKYSTTTCAAPKSTDGYLVTEAQLRKIVFDVSVQCAPGYQGAAKVAPCVSQGGAYTLSGCSAAPVCVSPMDLTGYSVTETSLDRGTFKVQAKCSATHIGEPKVTACTKNLGTYSITGCVPKIQCASPENSHYVVTEKNTVAQSFDVAATCARGYEGTAVVTPCSKTGQQYQLSGCKYSTTTCVAPPTTKGYLVTEAHLRKIIFEVTECTKNLGTYSITGCAKKIECASPSFDGYAVTEKNTVAQSFDIAATCARGYEGTAVAAACSKTGEKYTLSGCKYSTTTCVAPPATKGYLVTEAELRKIIFEVTECTSNLGAYSITGCVPKIQCTSPSKDGYVVTETSTVAQHFVVPVSCAAGYEGKAVVTACSKTGEPYTLSGCKFDTATCVAPHTTQGYMVTEAALRKAIFDVKVQCAPGFTGAAKVTKCNLHGEPYTLSGCSRVPLCVAPSDVTGYEVTETSLDRDSFNVKVKCAKGYSGSPSVTKCSNALRSYSLAGCQRIPVCLSPRSVDGYLVTEHSMEMGKFNVQVTCAPGYTGTGTATVCGASLQSYSLSGCTKR
eukprot:s2486_g6.t1